MKYDVEFIKVDDLHPYEKNAKKHPVYNMGKWICNRCGKELFEKPYKNQTCDCKGRFAKFTTCEKCGKWFKNEKGYKFCSAECGRGKHDRDGKIEVICDCFGGSGSTLIACEQLNRKCYMAELDPKYVSVILQRYINLKGTDADVFLIKDGEKIPYSEL